MRLPTTSAASGRADLRLVQASPLPAGRADLTRAEYIAALSAVLVLGFAVRAIFVLGAGFPINDGGMFYAMARDLQANSYALPAFTSYNGGEIPFAYPPAGFYIAAFLDDHTPISLLASFQYLPLMFSTLTIAAFWLLAKDLLRSRIATVSAVFFFAMMPPTGVVGRCCRRRPLSLSLSQKERKKERKKERERERERKKKRNTLPY